MASRLLRALGRKKSTADDGGSSKLARVLTLVDLTGLGIGSTLGLGVYVLAGAVAKTVAGPAVCISFLIAAIASAVAGLCYAEFAARVPKAGSAYVYSYVSVGEFVAYVIGWNLVLEYVIGTAGVARGLSNYIDALTNNTIKRTITEVMPVDVSFLAPYPDFLSFAFVALMTGILASGVKESTTLNNIFTGLNLATVAIVLIAGSMKADIQNWKIPKEKIPATVQNAGEGGFAPFGMSGIMAGAAKCFFGFVGFDCIATTGEEAKNPQKNIPLAIIISLVVIFLAYFGISTVLTMMWPYYLQDADAPFPHVFDEVGWPVIKWIVTIGAIFALCTSLMGAMFPLPRILYAMANDGVLFTFLSKVHPKTKTPLVATIISGLLAGIMATMFDLQQLIDMMSIGTLLAYTIVAICVLILRYEESNNYDYPSSKPKDEEFEIVMFNGFKKMFNLNRNKYPDSASSSITKWGISFYSVLAIALCSYIIYGGNYIHPDYPFCLGVFVAVAVVMLVILVIIARQPTSHNKLSFKVPWVPVIPCVSIVINLYLMIELDMHTWIRFAVWLLMGFLIYFCYGLQHSFERDSNKPKKSIDSQNPSNMANFVIENEHAEEVKVSETSGDPKVTTKF